MYAQSKNASTRAEEARKRALVGSGHIMADGFRLAVRGRHETADQVLAEAGQLGQHIRDGGKFAGLLVPAAPPLNVKGHVHIPGGEDKGDWTVLELPAYAANLWAYEEATRLRGQTLDRTRLVGQLAEQVGDLVRDNMKEGWFNQSALQCQAQLALALPEVLADNQVGLAGRSFERVVRAWWQHGHLELQDQLYREWWSRNPWAPQDYAPLPVELDGLIRDVQVLDVVVNVRSPITGAKNAKRVSLVRMPKGTALEGLLYCTDFRAARELLGDFDGDLVKIVVNDSPASVGFSVETGEPDPIRFLASDPNLVEYLLAKRQELDHQGRADTVVGMRVRKVMTGLMTYWIHCWLAVSSDPSVSEHVDDLDRPEWVRDHYVRGFDEDLFEGISEIVFDAFKVPEKVGEETDVQALNRRLAEIQRMGNAITGWLDTGRISSRRLLTALAPFCDKAQISAVKSMIFTLGTDLSGLEARGSSALQRAGKRNPVRAREALLRVARAHLGHRDDGKDLVDRLTDDATGAAEFRIASPEPKEPSEGRMDWWKIEPSYEGRYPVLEALRFDGRQVFKVMKADPTTMTLTVQVTPWWKVRRSKKTGQLEGQPKFNFTVELRLPGFTKLTTNGHGIVSYPELADRLFRPIFRFQSGRDGFQEIRWVGAQSGWIREGMSSIERVRLTARSGDFLQKKLQGLVVDYFQDRLIRVSEPGTREGGLMRSVEEYVVEFQGVESNIPAELELVRSAMVQLSQAGYNVLQGSKNNPGEVVSRPGSYGITDYAAAVYPLAQYGRQSPKTQAELRSLASAIEIHDAMELNQLIETDVPIPDFFTGKMKMVRYVIADGRFNVEVDANGLAEDSLDPMFFTPEGHDWIRPAHEVVRCDPEEWLEKKVKMIEAGLEQVGIETFEDFEVRWDWRDGRQNSNLKPTMVPLTRVVRSVWRHKGPDGGKTKTIGFGKSIQNSLGINLRTLDSVSIHGVVPQFTAKKKLGLDFLLLGLAYRVGILYIPADETPEELWVRIQEAAKDQGIRLGPEYILTGPQDDPTVVGRGWVVELPTYRDQHTSASYFSIRERKALELHSRIMLGWNQPETEGTLERRATIERFLPLLVAADEEYTRLTAKEDQ